MSDEIIKILDDLSERFGMAIDWSAENVLPYAQELFQKFVDYEIWTSVLWLVVGAAIIVAAVMMTKKWWSDGNEEYDGAILILTVPMILLGSAFFFPQAIDIITALTFPEKLLFEYLNDIAK